MASINEGEPGEQFQPPIRAPLDKNLNIENNLTIFSGYIQLQLSQSFHAQDSREAGHLLLKGGIR